MDSLAEFPIYDGSGRPSIKNALFEAGFGLPTIWLNLKLKKRENYLELK